MRLLLSALLTLAATAGYAQPPVGQPIPPPKPPAPVPKVEPTKPQPEQAKETHFAARIGKQVKLGAKLTPPDQKKPVVRLAQFLPSTPISLPAEVDYWSTPAACTVMSHMYLNDRFGCCVISGKAHAIGLAAAADKGAAIEFTDDEIQRTYFQFSPRDEGCVITEVLDYQRDRGFDWGGKNWRTDGYVQVNSGNKEQVKAAIYLFGPNTIGFAVPQSWISTAAPNAVWTPTNSQIVGGHDVTLVGYDAEGVYLSTWGIAGTPDRTKRPVKMSWPAFTSTAWVSEMYAPLYPEWYGSDKLSPTGLDVSGLKKALDDIKNGRIPDAPPPAPVPPAPVPPIPTPTPPSPIPVPPVVFPIYDVTVAGHLPYLGNVTLTGTAKPRAAGATIPSKLGIADWLKVIRFLRELIALVEGTFGQPAHAQAVAGLSIGDLQKWLPVILREIEIAAPVILADLAAGKGVGATVLDVIAALIAGGFGPVAPAAGETFDAPPAGLTSPGPGFQWRSLPGVGPGWVHDGVAAVTPASLPGFANPVAFPAAPAPRMPAIAPFGGVFAQPLTRLGGTVRQQIGAAVCGPVGCPPR